MTESIVADPVTIGPTTERPALAPVPAGGDRSCHPASGGLSHPALGGLCRSTPRSDRGGAAVTPPGPLGLLGRIRRKLTASVKVDTDNVIQDVQDAGRPKPTFGPRMGSHTTAWATHVFGIKAALRGHPLAEATMRLDLIVSEIERLPGYRLLASAPEAQKKRFADELGALHAARRALDDKSKAPAVTDVQDYITAYLNLREAVPMSVIDSAQMTSGNPTAGTGETVNALMQHAGGTAVEPVHLLNEIVGLLDVGRIAQALAELDDDRVPAVVPGLPTAVEGEVVDQRQRAEVLVDQHLTSIQTSFPGALAALGKVAVEAAPDEEMVVGERDPEAQHAAEKASLRAARDRKQRADEKALPSVRDRIVEDEILPLMVQLGLVRIDDWNRDLVLEREKMRRADGVGTSKKDRTTAAETKRVSAEKIRDLQAKIDRLSLRIGLLSESASKGKDSKSSTETDTAMSDGTKADGEGAQSSTRSRKRALSTAEDKQADEKRTAEVERRSKMIKSLRGRDRLKRTRDPNAVTKGNITVQVVLGPKDTVADLKIAGRPKSPFSGTMGAHTTAWVVHEDRVRTLLENQPLAEAIRLVTEDLADERGDTEKAFASTFSITRPGDGEDGSDPVASEADADVDASDGGSAPKRSKVDTTSVANQVGVLQAAILAHFEAVNQIPGAALPGATGGDTEGTARGLLRALPKPDAPRDAFDAIDQAPVRAAIAQLLDVRYLDQDEDTDDEDRDLNVTGGSDEAKRTLALEHLIMINRAYPSALAAAGLKVPTGRKSPAVNSLLKQLEVKAKTSNNGDGDAKERGSDASRPKKRAKRTHDTDVTPVAKGADTEPDPDAMSDAEAEKDIEIDVEEKPTSDESLKLDTSLTGTAPELSAGHDDARPEIPRLTAVPREDPTQVREAAMARRLRDAAHWFTEDGTPQAARVTELVQAYQQDLADQGTYLGEGEADLIARRLGLFVHLYKGGLPPGFVRIENDGDGDCLIHALWQIRAARDLRGDGAAMSDTPGVADAELPGRIAADGGAPAGEVTTIRAALRDDMSTERMTQQLTVAVVPAMIGNAVDGRPPDRVGSRVRRLLRGASFLSAVRVIRERKAINAYFEEEERKEVEAEKRRKEARSKARDKPKADTAKPVVDSGEDTVMIHVASEPEKPESKKPDPKKPELPDAKPVMPVPAIHRVSVGAGEHELTHQALLHVNENHYVAILRVH